jgi:protein O-GlcNAc transferase
MYERSPGSVRALRGLASAFEESGDTARAAAALRKAVDLAPEDAESWYQSGLLDSRTGRTAEAIEKIQKAIVLDPSLPEKSRKLAEILVTAGQSDRAQAALRDALRIDPYDEAAWNLAGRILSAKGETAQAMYYFERAVRLRPDSAPHLYDYALALARADRLDEAMERATAAAGYAPAQALVSRLHLRFGQVLAAKGDRDRAIQHYREAAKAADPGIAGQAAGWLQQLGVR